MVAVVVVVVVAVVAQHVPFNPFPSSNPKNGKSFQTPGAAIVPVYVDRNKKAWALLLGALVVGTRKVSSLGQFHIPIARAFGCFSKLLSTRWLGSFTESPLVCPRFCDGQYLC